MELICTHCGKVITVPKKPTEKVEICPHCLKRVDLTRPMLDWKTGFQDKSGYRDRPK